MKTPRKFFEPLAIGAPAPLRDLPVKVERMIQFVPAHLEKVRAKVGKLPPRRRSASICWASASVFSASAGSLIGRKISARRTSVPDGTLFSRSSSSSISAWLTVPRSPAILLTVRNQAISVST